MLTRLRALTNDDNGGLEIIRNIDRATIKNGNDR